MINLTIPVYNAEAQLVACVRQLVFFLAAQPAIDYELVIMNNGSTDRTLEIGRELEREYPQVRISHLDLKGRGRALKQAWLASSADILSYMDVDLSTDLAAYPAMVAALVGGQYDLTTGSRLLAGSRTTRCRKREAISRAYNWLVRTAFQTRFSDAQCGFKAVTRQAAQKLLPLVEDTGWFFDTELLVLAERLGYRVRDLPVCWVENKDSRVRILSTAIADIKGILRLRKMLKLKNGSQHINNGSDRITQVHNLWK
jgi:glycosyltransferase involved in cell wall biosynthesis